MNVLAVVIRTIFILALVVIVARKCWPGEEFATPLAQLTLGDLFFGFVKIAMGFGIGAFLLVRLVAIPSRENRSHEWEGWWLMTAMMLISLLALALLVPQSDRNHGFMHAISAAILTAFGWLIS